MAEGDRFGGPFGTGWSGCDAGSDRPTARTSGRTTPHMIDTHAHVDTRPCEDFEWMALGGVTDVLTLAHDPLKMSSSVVLGDHFERLFAERARVEKYGVRLHVCLGMHPRVRPRDLPACLALLESYLSNGARRVVAVGEVGLETRDPFEAQMLGRQVELAMRHDLPVIVHTPRTDKAPMTREILGFLSTFAIDQQRVVIDHADTETVKPIQDAGFVAGLSVQPAKLSPMQVDHAPRA
jgi:predicted metal-dependent TIM-barrel fold hydrolase